MSHLPESWLNVTIGDVADVNPRKNVDLTGDELVSFVRMAAVDEVSGTIAAPVDRPYLEVSRGFTHFQNGDVIFAKITPSMENGKSAIASGLTNGVGMGSTEFHVFRSRGAIEPEYLWRFVRQKSFRDAAQSVMSGAVGQQRVPATYLRDRTIPLAPLPEQRRIVTKVEGFDARIGNARDELEQIPALIARYKSEILASAFAGRLTREWRKQVGRQEGDGGGCPISWTVRSLSEIGEIQGGIQVGKKRPASSVLVEVPYLRVANVQRGWLNLDEIKSLGVTAAERDRLLLKDGDILMNEGGDRDKLGRGWVWRTQIPVCIHQNHVFRVRLFDEDFPSEFVSHYANENGQQYFIDQGKQTTNLASISKKKVETFPIPIPPTDEAVEIVRRIEASLSWLDRVSSDHAKASALLYKLDSAIVAKAFQGRLIPQDPDDEPAAELLDKISTKTTQHLIRLEERPAGKNKIGKQGMTLAKNLEQVLKEADGWVAAQTAFERCGISDGAPTEEIEKLYAELRNLDKAGRLEAQAVNDSQGRKLHDLLRLKAA